MSKKYRGVWFQFGAPNGKKLHTFLITVTISSPFDHLSGYGIQEKWRKTENGGLRDNLEGQY